MPKRLTLGLLLMGLALLSACSLLRPKPHVQPWLSVLPPASLQQQLWALQKVSGERQGDSFVLLFQVEVDATQMALVGSAVSGTTLFSVHYQDGEISAERSPFLPAVLDPAFVLADFQLAYWPLPAVAAALAGTPYRVEQAGDTRQLWQADELLASVHYSSADPWQGPVQFDNKHWGYQYQIETLQYETH
ncbi:DUF3261 domain-containing protein [Halioxenophilus sp. WMMB6]|uniref:DUF3261 domain-containing protein n=1 Tax=Halioxenophilus sp. WMMB6 TaxID=3073815 RepID=UPI00295EB141|nr:DUF3261 domain-containing protein [Halioxenophilus sp. WMMB6]